MCSSDLYQNPGSGFNNMIVSDGFAAFFRLVVLAVGLLTVLCSTSYLQRENSNTGEFYVLLLFSLAGQCLMAAANELIMVFIGLEISSIASYILAGYLRDTLLTAIAPMLWGTTYILTTQVLPPDRPYTAAVIRVLPAGLILLAWARSMPARGWWLRLGILAALNIGIFQALLFIAAYRLPGGLAAIFGALQPLITMALASLANRRSPGWRMISVALLGLPGMAMLLWAPGMQWDLTGVIAAFAGVCCVSAGAFLVRRWQPPMSVIALTGWQCALGGLMLLPLALLLEPSLPALSLQQIAGYKIGRAHV